jgi:acetyl esterase/lipase
VRVTNRFLVHLIKGSLRLTFKLPSRLPLPVTAMRSGMDKSSGILPVRKDVQVKRVDLGGVPAERISPAASAGHKTDSIILHLHGGAFMAGSVETHRALAGELAVRSGAAVYVPSYRLAPEHPWPAAPDDALTAWHALIKLGYAPENIVVGGDSAGATLAISLAIRLRDVEQPLPAALYLLSPYVDSSLSGASIRTCKHRDPMLTVSMLKRGSDGYRGDLPADDPRISPLFADLHGLPPVLIQVGTEEILLDDALRLEDRFRAAGVAVDCQTYPGMWHDFQLFSRFIEEADVALDRLVRFLE